MLQLYCSYRQLIVMPGVIETMIAQQSTCYPAAPASSFPSFPSLPHRRFCTVGVGSGTGSGGASGGSAWCKCAELSREETMSSWVIRCCRTNCKMIEGSLEVKPREEAQSEEQESEERRSKCAKRKGRKVAKHCVYKLHASVAQSTFRYQMLKGPQCWSAFGSRAA